MARGEAPDRRCGEGAGNDEIATGAPAANGNGGQGLPPKGE